MAEDVIKQVDYSAMSYDELMVEVGKAWEAKDMKLMGKLSRLATEAEKAVEKAKKEALLAELVEITKSTRDTLARDINKLIEAGKLDGAEGVWFAWDFGEKEELGINPACRLVKSGRKASSGGGAVKSSYVAGLPSNKEMLAQAGDSTMFKDDTVVTIDKQEHTMLAGTTFQEAQDYSTNGGWRNRVRMALGKELGLV